MKVNFKFVLLSLLIFNQSVFSKEIKESTYLSNIAENKYDLYNEILKSKPVNQNNNQSNVGEYKIINCWDEAGKKYNLDPWLIFAYAQTESSLNPNAVNKNKSSIDRGIMQINSYWLGTLKKYNIGVENLFDSCVSIFVGSWIIRQNINQYGYTYNGLVAYNVGNPNDPNKRSAGLEYYKRLSKNYHALKKKYDVDLISKK